MEEDRNVSWLRTDPSDAVYVRGDARRAAAMAGGSSVWGAGWVHDPNGPAVCTACDVCRLGAGGVGTQAVGAWMFAYGAERCTWRRGVRCLVAVRCLSEFGVHILDGSL